jgi:hypothetical protein
MIHKEYCIVCVLEDGKTIVQQVRDERELGLHLVPI